MFDFNHPFFKPLWIRILVVAFTLGWALFELSMGATFWAMLFGAMGLAALWGLFVTFNPRDDVKKQ
ncbi:MAG TPA: DUF3329 domain-containing protein [Rhizobiaceae bacterium]|nr:DUF3329 domain-containing protein [Rhizobiaceae bacterium]